MITWYGAQTGHTITKILHTVWPKYNKDYLNRRDTLLEKSP